MNILTGAVYLDQEQLKGFDNYKYSCRDTSPYSVYVVNPFWNKMVTLLPRWIAPNLMTMVGFLLVLSTFLLLSWYDYDYRSTRDIPAWVWLYSAVAHIMGYHLDGMDGKQARRTKTSTPLGELFDHGLDSLVAVILPLATSSVLGLQGRMALTEELIFFTVLIGIFGFYVTHWEKYNTGVLFLPWVYDFVHQGVSFGYLITGVFGVSLWPDVETFLNSRGVAISLVALYTFCMAAGTAISFVVSSWNVISSYVNKQHKRDSLTDAMSPFVTVCCLVAMFVVWAVVSPNRIMHKELRCFCSVLGIVFSNITCNLIIAQMSGVKFRVYNGLVLLSFFCVPISVLLPQIEITVLYAYLIVAMLCHFNFGYSVVKELCSHFKIDCFRIPYQEKNS